MLRTLLIAACLLASGADGEPIRFDFESGDLQGWVVVDGRFDTLVSDRALCRNTPGTAYNKQGRYFLGTLEKPNGAYADEMTGVVESPVFVPSAPEASFLIGGGSHTNTYLALCTVDGEEVLTAQGRNEEMLRRVTWDLTPWIGQKVYLSIVDRNTGSWGHVTFDDFVAEGTIDSEASKALHGTFAQREEQRAVRAKERAARQEEARAKRRIELMDEGMLFARGEPRVYRDKNLEAIGLPLGGIGAGCIQMDGRAVLRSWQIFNNHKEATVPDSFFAVRVKTAAGAATRALQTEAAGPFEPMASLSFRGTYPFGWYAFEDGQVAARISLEAFNPLIPLDLRASSMPCAVFNLTAENPTPEAIEVAFLAVQQNAVGFNPGAPIGGRRQAVYGGNVNTVTRENGATLLRMTSKKRPVAPSSGDMALLALSDAATGAAEGTPETFLADFADDGQLTGRPQAGPTPLEETLDGALAVSFTLAPGERRTVPFALAWYFPNAVNGDGGWTHLGNHYVNEWSDARAVALELAKRLPELTEKSRRYVDTLNASNLPQHVVDRVSSQVAILRTRTCYWSRDGYFGGWEGCGGANGCCLGNCSHVWHYAQAHARLFPQLGRTMREQEFRLQTPDGGVPHRQVAGIEPATDGQLGAILGAYREYLLCTDGAWLKSQWPAVRKAMDYVIANWDADEDGALAGRQWNTLDDALGGSTSWMGSLYLAGLAACERMATLQGDADVAQRYLRIREAGMKKQDETLFNGEYYFQIPDPEPRKDYNDGCHVDQVLGQWWAHQLDLGWLYPRDRVRTALTSLVRYNFHADFGGIAQAPRKFVADEDPALQMITWPKGNRPDPEHCIYYGDEVMSGFEYAAAAAMIQAGLLREGFTVSNAINERYDGRLRTGLTPGDTASWGYSGNPFGDDECGKFYARAMSSWSLLLACQGFTYDGPAGTIGFKPVWKPEDHASFFSTAEGWGLFSQKRTEGQQVESIELRYGKLRLASVTLEVAEGATVKAASATIGDAPVACSFTQNGGAVVLTFAEGLTLNEGQTLTIALGL